MSERQWRASAEPRRMFALIEVDAGDVRKMRLLACAACRRIWELIDNAKCKAAVEATEQCADGYISEQTLGLLFKEAERALYETYPIRAETELVRNVADAACHASHPALTPYELLQSLEAAAKVSPKGIRPETVVQANLVRDIFGNPFRPVVFDPAWRTDTAVTLARQMYDSREFGAMPILADALQDAGCDNTDVLNHCREANATHVRGCWLVDLVLGKM